MKSRREMLRSLAAWFLPVFAPAGCPADVRPYRADAVLTLGSLPLYRRRGVGSGYAVCRRLEGDSGAAWFLGFAGGSWPERAVGLNRLGYYCELAADGDGAALESAYFGFLTVSEERDLAQARQSVKDPQRTSRFSVIEGRLGRTAFCRTARFSAPAELRWPQWPSLLARAVEAVRSERAACRDKDGRSPFLRAVLEAVRSPAPDRSQLFVYGGQAHRLETSKRPAADLSERFGRPVVILSGAVHSAKTGARSRFRLWLEQDPAVPLPLRIELRPRPFLRLAFEYDPAVLQRDGVERMPFAAHGPGLSPWAKRATTGPTG